MLIFLFCFISFALLQLRDANFVTQRAARSYSIVEYREREWVRQQSAISRAEI